VPPLRPAAFQTTLSFILFYSIGVLKSARLASKSARTLADIRLRQGSILGALGERLDLIDAVMMLMPALTKAGSDSTPLDDESKTAGFISSNSQG
jgi:hypothetical protein